MNSVANNRVYCNACSTMVPTGTDRCTQCGHARDESVGSEQCKCASCLKELAKQAKKKGQAAAI